MRYHEAVTVATVTVCVMVTGFAAPAAVAAQDMNFLRSIPEIEQLFLVEPFSIIDWRGSRAEGDRTQRVALQFNDSTVLLGKWGTAPENGAAFNNEPRYELGAYVLQKLFLEENEYVVPPTVIRAFDLAFVRQHQPSTKPTFREAEGSVLVSLQYWMNGVSPENFWDERRAEADPVYARHIANMNILTYVIRHRDANVGNFLISLDSANPRVFSVDNGVSFDSEPSNRGAEWGLIRVDRLPAATIERLQRITREDLDRTLGVLVELEIRDGLLVPVEPGVNMNAGRGVRRSRDRIQIGLTSREISGVENRIRNLLNQASRGRYPIF